MKITFKPLGDRVLIERIEAAAKSAAGLLLPTSERDLPQEGVVLAVGKGSKGEKMTVKLGDKVIFSKFAGSDVKLNGSKYIIMREGDIFGIK